jgi:hypothetical protein
MFTTLRLIAFQSAVALRAALLCSVLHFHSQRIAVLFSVAISRGAELLNAIFRKPQGGLTTPNLPNPNHVSSQISNYP